MKVYNEEKTQILIEFDRDKGRLVEDKMLVEVLPAQEEVKEQGHYETIKEYPNGGQDVKWVVDVEGIPAREETPVYEDILVYIPYTKEEYLEHLRYKRQRDCFDVLTNYSKFWYDALTEEQHTELGNWYKEWLDVTETKIIPTKPSWLK
jgi:hypothetical protein